MFKENGLFSGKIKALVLALLLPNYDLECLTLLLQREHVRAHTIYTDGPCSHASISDARMHTHRLHR